MRRRGGGGRSTMTLVDLPGLSKVAVGDQPGDIEARTRAMILDYIRHPTCIVLAVSPANADIVNSDALELARSVDPDGHRTIGAPPTLVVHRVFAFMTLTPQEDRSLLSSIDAHPECALASPMRLPLLYLFELRIRFTFLNGFLNSIRN